MRISDWSSDVCSSDLPTVYGAGQLLHIVGLVWSGGYGVQRKVAGAEQSLRSISEVAGMGLMGLGGLIAIIGGLLFVVVVAKALRGCDSRSEEHTSELQSLMRISYAVFCLKKTKKTNRHRSPHNHD